jgi:hypothetical protein
MPHRNNGIKMTGDTHPPEVEYDLSLDDGEPLTQDVQGRPGAAVARTNDANLQGYASAMRMQAPSLKTIGITLAVGYLLMKLLRR